jgi:hypothetical protein
MQLHAVSLRPRNLSLQQIVPESVQWTGSMKPIVLRKYPKGIFKAARAARDNAEVAAEQPKPPTEEEMIKAFEMAKLMFPTVNLELDLTPPKTRVSIPKSKY